MLPIKAPWRLVVLYFVAGLSILITGRSYLQMRNTHRIRIANVTRSYLQTRNINRQFVANETTRSYRQTINIRRQSVANVTTRTYLPTTNTSQPFVANVTKDFTREVTHSQNIKSCTDGVTVVTAYFFIPKFIKGGGKNYFSNQTYFNWAKVFANIVNPLVVYTDSESFVQLMTDARKGRANVTKIFKIDPKTLWAFQREPTIREIFNQPGYPKHHPNTVIPTYSCAQHAKIEVLSRAAAENYYRTNYFAWLDVGYFRDIENDNRSFVLEKPSDFNSSKIGMNEVASFQDISPEKIFKGNIFWVGGGLVLGHRLLIQRYEMQYKRAFEYFLDKKLMNTDQQVVYSMFSKAGREAIKPEIELQVFRGSWFHLGFLMRRILI